MNIVFLLPWVPKKTGAWTRSFKYEGLYETVANYVEKITLFAPTEVRGVTPEEIRHGMKTTGGRVVRWVCDLPRKTSEKLLSSEDLAQKLQKVQNQGVAELQIYVGGPDGWSKEDLEALKPDLIWSFGPLTLPHELALTVATEQIYRAYTILKNHPYHTGH